MRQSDKTHRSAQEGLAGSYSGQPIHSRNSSSGGTPHFGSAAFRSSSKAECQDQQCAEEECDPEECGDDVRAPRADNFTCGVDHRPVLPVALILSTFLGALCMLMLQRPLLSQILASSILAFVTVLLIFLYVVTLGCMAYCALCDPGQIHREENKAQHPLPRRSHTAWLYQLPIRRYDHYCRWLTNVIGLLNHREFIIMCVGIVVIGLLGAALDALLVISIAHRGNWINEILLILHLAYSITLVALAGPILRLHVGLVSRNELANEWKNNDFYIVHSPRSGKKVHVNELDDDEFNERFDSFVYDHERNAFDKGTTLNCWAFWCTPRWSSGQLGDF